MPPTIWSRLRAQLAAWRAERAAAGTRAATVHRVRRTLDLGPVTSGRVDQMSHQISELVDASRRFDESAQLLIGETDRALHEAQRATAAATRADEDHEIAQVLQQVAALTSWLETVPVAAETLVSVVLPTRGSRPASLYRAVESVRAQRHDRWQLVVVVDAPEPTRREVAEELPGDARIEIVQGAGAGVSAARNCGLDAARGELVAYLDDDNVMGPLWLRALVWAAERHPEAEVFYGAEVVDAPGARGYAGSFPALHLERFDRRRLRHGNYIDQNVVAHRRGLRDAYYDESLAANVDWDFLLRATAERDPVMVPVLASLYSTDAEDRLTGSVEAARTWPVVRARARAMAPIRILAMNQMYPLITESYIGEELDALEAEGAEIACCVLNRRVAPAQSPYRLYHDPRQAVAEHEPDLVLLHWAGVGHKYRELLRELGVPYAVRGHSFANEAEQSRLLVDDPQCIGVWCFPQHVSEHEKLHPLPVVFTSHHRMPPPAPVRDLVLSTSAGLPKKDFPLLLEALAPLTDVERRVVVGTTADFEHVITDIVLALRAYDEPPLVQANLTRDDVFALLARTSALVYTLAPGSGFGMPMSVVEGMTAGACVILPAFVPARDVFGPDVRTYETAEDITAHVRTIVAGGPAIDAERERVRMFALEQFCDPETGKRFYAELVDALAAAAPVT